MRGARGAGAAGHGERRGRVAAGAGAAGAAAAGGSGQAHSAAGAGAARRRAARGPAGLPVRPRGLPGQGGGAELRPAQPGGEPGKAGVRAAGGGRCPAPPPLHPPSVATARRPAETWQGEGPAGAARRPGWGREGEPVWGRPFACPRGRRGNLAEGGESGRGVLGASCTAPAPRRAWPLPTLRGSRSTLCLWGASGTSSITLLSHPAGFGNEQPTVHHFCVFLSCLFWSYSNKPRGGAAVCSAVPGVGQISPTAGGLCSYSSLPLGHLPGPC